MNSISPEQVTRAKNSILGAFVADAATMGFHWLYSQRRISELAPGEPEFRQPSESDFEGNVGYFAHGAKQAGHQIKNMRIIVDDKDGRFLCHGHRITVI